MRHWTIIAVFCLSGVLAYGCSDDSESKLEEEGRTEQGEQTEQEYVVPDPDYSFLTASNHPRVIYTDDDFASMAALRAAGTNESFNKIHDVIISVADSYVNSSNLEYKLSGKRLLTVSRNAELRILASAYAYKTTGERKYLERAETDIKTVSAFQDWNAIKHFLDAGEMSAAVGLGYDWLYNDLSEDTKKLARQAVNDFAFHPALYEKPDNNFYSSLSNWNEVCNGGLVCGALAMYEDYPEDAQSIIDKAVSSNLTVLESLYSPNGNTPEGYAYWNYGTLYEVLMLTALETSIGSDSGLSLTEGFSNTGQYMVFMEGCSGTCFNYSDCSNITSPALAQWYFAWKFKDNSGLFIEKDRTSAAYESADEKRLLPLVAWYASQVDVSSVAAPSEHIFYGEGTTPVVLVHDTWTMDEDDKFLGIKGGMASTSHGHMDAGSFVYDSDGLRWASDLGMQSYTELEAVLDLWTMTDGSERWTVFRYNNFNHNTLTVNDTYHRTARAGVFTDIIDSNGRKGAVIDISALLSYELSSAVRTIYMDGDDLVVEDEITALDTKDAQIRWTMVTLASPVIENNWITLKQGNRTKYLTRTLSGGTKFNWATWSAQSENSWDEANTGYYECGYTMTVAAGNTAKVTIRLTPIDPLG